MPGCLFLRQRSKAGARSRLEGGIRGSSASRGGAQPAGDFRFSQLASDLGKLGDVPLLMAAARNRRGSVAPGLRRPRFTGRGVARGGAGALFFASLAAPLVPDYHAATRRDDKTPAARKRAQALMGPTPEASVDWVRRRRSSGYFAGWLAYQDARLSMIALL